MTCRCGGLRATETPIALRYTDDTTPREEASDFAQFVGPGEHIVLRTERADALFVWRKFIDDSGNDGVNCAVFRNESEHLSSELIRQADAVADFCWPGLRHYTYVRAEAVRSTNPGFCFLAAGWRRCGRTRGGLMTIERVAKEAPRG